MVERSEKTWSTGEGKGKPCQYSCLENSILAHEQYKKAKDRALKDELPGQFMPNMLLEISVELTPERMERQSQRKNNTQLWM